MKNPDIYSKWTKFITHNKYKIYFMSNNEEWLINFNNIQKYIDENNKRPSTHDNNQNIRIMSKWLSHQQTNYKSKKEIMKNSKIYDKWTEFITSEKYKKYFMSNEKEWLLILNKVKKYINENKKSISTIDKNNDVMLMGRWLNTQKQNYKNKKQIVWTNNDIKKLYENFICDPVYSIYISAEQEWFNWLDILKNYININKEIPTIKCNINGLYSWFAYQKNNSKYKKRGLMKNPEIYNKWIEFMSCDKYKIYFISNTELWNDKFDKVKKYIDDNNKKPLYSDKNNDIQTLALWIRTQQKNYRTKTEIMSDPEIYNKWTDFITDPQYKQYLD